MTDPKPKTRTRKGKGAQKRDDVIDVEAEEKEKKPGDGDGEDEEEEEKDDDVDPDTEVEVVGEIESVDDVGDEALEKIHSSERVSLIKRDPLQAYMQEARRFPLLTPDEEHDLAVKLFEHGDTAAARKLVEANLRLVVKIAYEYRRAHKNLLDLVQEGNIGLIQAVRKFDPYRGVKLSSYGAFWIRAYILKFILNNWRLVKIGTTQAQRKLFFNLRKEKEKLEAMGLTTVISTPDQVGAMVKSEIALYLKVVRAANIRID
jgi:RNA polymerase sigma-32 factor